MNAPTFISKIQKAGFHLALRGDVLEVSPASSLTDEQRRFIRTHKPALVAELKAANDPPPHIHERSTVDQAGFRRAAEIISRVAGEFRLDPADVWGWLSLDDIKAIATVDPAELASLRAHCRPWKAQGSTTTGDHALPWPLGLLPPGEPMPVRCADCQHQRPTQHPVLIECGAGRQAPGACGMWWSLDQHHCTQFEGCQP